MRSPSASPTSTATDRTRISASNCWPCIRKNSRPFRTCCGRSPMFRTSDATRRALVALLMTLVAVPLFADHSGDESRFETKYGKDMHYGGGKVSIDHRFGEL